MNPVFRGLLIYLVLLLIFRIAGKKSLSQTSTFELVLLLIISEVTQQALLGDDFSLTTSIILILTLIAADYLLGLLRIKSKLFDKITEGVPLLLVDKGEVLEDRLKKSRVQREDILESARKNQGLENMDQIKYAVLEKDGTISIIPKKNDQQT